MIALRVFLVSAATTLQLTGWHALSNAKGVASIANFSEHLAVRWCSVIRGARIV